MKAYKLGIYLRVCNCNVQYVFFCEVYRHLLPLTVFVLTFQVN